jgi:hypothetical protein
VQANAVKEAKEKEEEQITQQRSALLPLRQRIPLNPRIIFKFQPAESVELTIEQEPIRKLGPER